MITTNSKQKIILVTGGAGFIGYHLIKELLKRGDSVVCIDNMNDYYDPKIKEHRLSEFKDDITFYKVDIRDKDALDKIFSQEKIDIVCHLAAQAGVRYSIENPHSYAENNYSGTTNIFEAVKKYNVPHVVFASSSSVYGKNANMPCKESDVTDSPMSPYAASKKACELLAYSYNHLFGIDITCLRFFTVYGPLGRPDMALFKFTKAILNNKPIDVYNNGEMERDFTYIDDIVSGFISALNKPMGFSVFNLGNASPVKLNDFIKEIERVIGKEAKKNYLPMQQGDVSKTCADISKAKELLGYEPKVSIKEGVKNFVDWYRSYYKE